ncbi:dihydrofolate reductase family protein [Nitriliruptor alkaliphilus]|uniref:dihydrofolate reductase family protein n=1 Tax=Nitriliruptor alkaliphilus TaxID=427918 RepID=UPI000696E331|nr:dihydrofolate reductase family protein [Nitriliruptor alkaliphilus]
MRRLVPGPLDLDLDAVYQGLVLASPPPAADRASVALGMVASVDGAVALDGTSGGLGGEGDRRAFLRLRDACDAILVGAGTVRAEDYGPPRAPAARAAAREAAGLAPAPQLLVVTGRAALDPSARLFTAERDPGVPPPVVVTSSTAPGEAVASLAEVAQVATFGRDAVDLAAVLRWCHERGLRRVLCEGGPALNGALLAGGLVDEVFVTLAPVLVGGDAARIVRGPHLAPVDLELSEVHEHDGELLLRYRTSDPSTD